MPSSSRIELSVTGGFEHDWDGATRELKHEALGAIGDLLALIRAGERWGDRIQGVNKSHGTFEGIDVGPKNRLVVKSSEAPPVLFALGNHETKKRFQARLGEREVTGRHKPPPAIQDLVDAANGSGPIFPGGGAGPRAFVQRWEPELAPENWMYFLDEQQRKALREIEVDLLRLCLGEGWKGALHVLIGGPGTGKTSILLEAMRTAEDFERQGHRLNVRLEISSALREQVESATGMDLWRFCETPDWESERDSSVVLIDDPWSLYAIEEAAELSRRKNSDGKRPLVVIAVDPLQMAEWNRSNPDDGVTDESFFRALDVEGGVAASQHHLSACYRQKEKLGEIAYKAARTITERSSAYAASEKITAYTKAREELRSLCNQASFPNPSGWADLHERATFEHWAKYIAFVREQLRRDRQMGGSVPDPALLVVASRRSGGAPKGWLEQASAIPLRLVEGSYEDEIKGLEFNHVALLLGPDEIEALTKGLTKTGRLTFDMAVRPLRIALSRARDSMCVFGVADG